MLTREKIEHETRRVPGLGIVQVNVWDPDGNHIHIDFQPSEDNLAANADWGQKDAMIKR
jgi:hypothetical protein